MRFVQLPQRPASRRLRAVAVLLAIVLHVAAVLLVPFPAPPPGGDAVTLLLLTDVDEMPPPLPAPREAAPSAPIATGDPEAGGDAGSGGAAGSGDVARGDRGETVSANLVGAIPFLPRVPAGPSTAATSGGMTEARAATLPLVAGPGGIGSRRLGRTAEQLAVARAESLLVARLAGIAVVERRDTGAVGLANGGVTVAIPWPGFLPANRSDGKWREERCSGGVDGDSDKAGEGEARRAQCD